MGAKLEKICDFCGKTTREIPDFALMTPPESENQHAICSECVGNCMKLFAISNPALFAELVATANSIAAEND